MNFLGSRMATVQNEDDHNFKREGRGPDALGVACCALTSFAPISCHRICRIQQSACTLQNTAWQSLTARERETLEATDTGSIVKKLWNNTRLASKAQECRHHPFRQGKPSCEESARAFGPGPEATHTVRADATTSAQTRKVFSQALRPQELLCQGLLRDSFAPTKHFGPTVTDRIFALALGDC